jgi:Catalytic LigB subunit of aromatic ring-opening dioxygenase
MDGKGGTFEVMDKNSRLAADFKKLGSAIGPKPDAIVLVSAHWEESNTVHVTSSSNPELIYDYYGFPAETYELKYPAPGHPQLAAEVVAALQEANIPAQLDATRGTHKSIITRILDCSVQCANFSQATLILVHTRHFTNASHTCMHQRALNRLRPRSLCAPQAGVPRC